MRGAAVNELASPPAPRRLTKAERRGAWVIALLVAELITMLLPRARVDSYEGFFSTYYNAPVPSDWPEPIDVNGFFFGAAAAIEVVLMAIVALLALTLVLRRDLARGMRGRTLLAAAALVAWVALVTLSPGLLAGTPFRVLAGGYLGLAAALAAAGTLAALALTPDDDG